MAMIETERLHIRRVSPEDWRDIQAIWVGVTETIYAQYDRPNDTDEASVRKRINGWASFSESDAHMFFAVCLKNRVIGYVVFHQKGNGYEIGYCFHPDSHGKGYARESISALIDEMRANGCTRLYAGTALKNLPSVKLLLSLGFRQTGTESVSFYRDANGDKICFDGGIFKLQLL